MNFKEEYSEEFDELRKNRVKTSFYKYGSAKENFGKGYVDALGSLEKCLAKYRETGNTEYLLDAGNYAMFEYMYPQQEKSPLPGDGQQRERRYRWFKCWRG